MMCHTDAPSRVFLSMRHYILPLVLLFCTVAVGSAQFAVEIYDTDGIPSHVYKERRERLLHDLSPKSAVLLLSADVRNRQNDVDYEYRQNSDLLYLSGFPYAGGALLLVPAGVDVGGRRVREVLFVRDRVQSREQWTGVEMGPQEAMTILGVDTALPASGLKDFLDGLMPHLDSLFVPNFPTKSVTLSVLGRNVYMDGETRKGLKERYPDLVLSTSLPLLGAMREIKDTAELRLMQRAIDISIEGHIAMMKGAKPDMTEYELEALIEYTFKRLGAEDVGYPSIVGSRYNACILHYVTNRRRTTSDDLVLADCGAEYHGYTADITRTFPVNGRFTKEQRQIYDIVLEAQDSGIAASRAGNMFNAPHEAARKVIIKGLRNLGIIDSDSDVRKYFMHGTSHYLGLDVHDAGTRGPLKPNSVITVEPGIYIANDSPCDRKWWNIGIRIEDDILITTGDPINMSRALPRRADDIEGLVRQRSN